ncbi:type II secretion system protein J [Altericista sp. CCNU0014]|uniref:PulJ/GspJ family protein n=1 Tax=Altericista sp. CCNU0014 TaxID=3082949 RepID=UPI00384DA11B
MKSKPMLKRQQWLRQYSRRLGKDSSDLSGRDLGFTLIELLAASVLVSVVILVAWTGLLSVMNMTQAAEARSARQTELNRALDFMTNEIRMARSINQSATTKANGTTVTLADVVTSTGLSLPSLGSYGDIGLYLERDTRPNIPAKCPAGGPNAELPPPSPADYDRIVYDIRPSPSGWLSPKILVRYGRVPSSDGTIDPCSSPIAGDPMVDALAATRTPPPCSGVLSGSGGFYSCVTDNQADLFFQSTINNVGTKQVGSAVSSRLQSLTPSPPSTLTLTAELISPKEVKLKWAWFGSGKVSNYEVLLEWNGSTSSIYSGKATAISKYKIGFANDDDQVCFLVKAQTSSPTKVDSNQACVTKPGD